MRHSHYSGRTSNFRFFPSHGTRSKSRFACNERSPFLSVSRVLVPSSMEGVSRPSGRLGSGHSRRTCRAPSRRSGRSSSSRSSPSPCKRSTCLPGGNGRSQGPWATALRRHRRLLFRWKPRRCSHFLQIPPVSHQQPSSCLGNPCDSSSSCLYSNLNHKQISFVIDSNSSGICYITALRRNGQYAGWKASHAPLGGICN